MCRDQQVAGQLRHRDGPAGPVDKDLHRPSQHGQFTSLPGDAEAQGEGLAAHLGYPDVDLQWVVKGEGGEGAVARPGDDKRTAVRLHLRGRPAHTPRTRRSRFVPIQSV